MYKALRTSVVSVEPGRVRSIRPNRNLVVETDSLSTAKMNPRKNCVVVSLESGPSGTMTDHALDMNNARDLFLGLMGSLCMAGDPIALTLKDALPQSIDDIPIEYRS